MPLEVKQAQAEDLLLRMALIGPPGSGKSFTALKVATHLCGGPDVYGPKDIFFVDSERKSALKYTRRKNRPRGEGCWDFLHVNLTNHNPKTYVEAIGEAEKHRAKVLIIDSLSHAWVGHEGALETVDRISKQRGGGNNFTAWREVTPLHNQMIDKILGTNLHVIFTLRTKMAHEVEKDERTGKVAIKKLGLAPLMREGVEYETDIVADMDQENTMSISKTRCPALRGKVFYQPGKDVSDLIMDWLDIAPSGVEVPDAPQLVADPAAGLEALRAECKSINSTVRASAAEMAAALNLSPLPPLDEMDERTLQRLVHFLRQRKMLKDAETPPGKA